MADKKAAVGLSAIFALFGGLMIAGLLENKDPVYKGENLIVGPDSKGRQVAMEVTEIKHDDVVIVRFDVTEYSPSSGFTTKTFNQPINAKHGLEAIDKMGDMAEAIFNTWETTPAGPQPHKP